MEWDSFIPGFGNGEWGGPGYGDREDTPSHDDINDNRDWENLVKNDDDYGEDVDGNGNGDDAYDKHTIIYDEVDEYTAA